MRMARNDRNNTVFLLLLLLLLLRKIGIRNIIMSYE